MELEIDSRNLQLALKRAGLKAFTNMQKIITLTSLGYVAINL